MDFRQVILSPVDEPALLIRQLVSGIRPGRLEDPAFAVSRIEDLIHLLRSNEDCRNRLRKTLEEILYKSSSIRLLTLSGLEGTGNIYSDVIQKVKHSLLPPLPDSSDLASAINRVFFRDSDYKWVNAVPESLWKSLLDAAGLKLNLVPFGHELDEVLNAILILSHRMAVLGLDPHLVSKIPGISNLDSPFFQQNREITAYIDKIRSQRVLPDQNLVEYKHILNTFENCSQKLLYIHLNRQQIGAGLKLTYVSLQLESYMNRMRALFRILHDEPGARELSLIRLFKELVEHENTKYKIGRHISSNIGLLAFQVTENAAKTGEHYISTDRKEYFAFLKNALGGGMIVGFLVCIKIFVYYNHFPPLIETMANGLNYGIGFLIIHFAGFTLATKQPAMTASALAGAFEGENNGNRGLAQLASMIVKISRTQFISFFGNLVMVFPTVWILSFLWYQLNGSYMADPVKAMKLLIELDPFQSYSVWYAAIAGVLLFSAGLISGYFDNKMVFNRIPERILAHPGLKRIPRKRLEKITGYLSENMGGMAGNFILGILLASMAFFGFILGLPLDVRHVTFVTGNFGMAFSCLDNYIASDIFWLTVLSIVMVGFVNFIVSFSLAIITAMRARKVKFRQTLTLLNMLKAYAFTYPLDFFFPPSVERYKDMGDDVSRKHGSH